MSDLASEIKPVSTTEQGTSLFHDDLFASVKLPTMQEVIASKNALPTVTRVADTTPATGLLSPTLEQNLKDVQQALAATQKQIAELQKTSNTGLYDQELSRRSMIENPQKWLTAGTGLALLYKSPMLGSIPLAGFAGLQGYDDFKNLRDQSTFAGRGKYTLGLLADTATGAGALAFLTDSVPMKYKAPLLIGGMVARAAIDFIPNKK